MASGKTYLEMCIIHMDAQLRDLHSIKRKAEDLKLNPAPVVAIIRKVQAAREELFLAQERHGSFIHSIERQV